MEASEHVSHYRDYTRYLKPVRPINFSDLEVLQTMLTGDLDPDEIASVSQLLGTRRGVIRVTFKTLASVDKLEQLVQKRRLCIGSVPLGIVSEDGQFILVVLENVPQFVKDGEVEKEMSAYGIVVESNKEYLEYRGCRIENERRNVLFTAIFNRAALNGELRLFGTTVYSKMPYVDASECPNDGEPDAVTESAGTNSGEGGVRQDKNEQRHSTSKEPSFRLKSRETPGMVVAQQQQQQQPQPSRGLGTVRPVMVRDQLDPTPSINVRGQQACSEAASIVHGQTHHGINKATAHGKSPIIGIDSRQRQKRTEAFAQLSAFLQ